MHCDVKTIFHAGYLISISYDKTSKFLVPKSYELVYKRKSSLVDENSYEKNITHQKNFAYMIK